MKMKAAVIREMGAKQPYAESKPMKIEEVEIGAPEERELLIQIKAALELIEYRLQGILHSFPFGTRYCR